MAQTRSTGLPERPAILGSCSNISHVKQHIKSYCEVVCSMNDGALESTHAHACRRPRQHGAINKRQPLIAAMSYAKQKRRDDDGSQASSEFLKPLRNNPLTIFSSYNGIINEMFIKCKQ